MTDTDRKPMIEDNKVSGYLSMFNFLLAFLIGYYYGMHYAAIVTAFVSIGIGYSRYTTELKIIKQAWTLGSPFIMMLGVAFINPTVLPFAISGTLFTFLGLYLKSLQQPITTKAIIGGTALILATYGGWHWYPKFAQEVMLKQSNQNISSFDLTQMDGNTFTYSPSQNQVVLIDFWATWCKPCRDEFKELETVYTHFENNPNVKILIANAANSGDEWQKVVAFANSGDFNLPFYMDQTGQISGQLGINQFPTLTLLDQQGNVQFIHEGYSNAENLDEFLISKIEELVNPSN